MRKRTGWWLILCGLLIACPINSALAGPRLVQGQALRPRRQAEQGEPPQARRIGLPVTRRGFLRRLIRPRAPELTVEPAKRWTAPGWVLEALHVSPEDIEGYLKREDPGIIVERLVRYLRAHPEAIPPAWEVVNAHYRPAQPGQPIMVGSLEAIRQLEPPQALARLSLEALQDESISRTITHMARMGRREFLRLAGLGVSGLAVGIRPEEILLGRRSVAPGFDPLLKITQVEAFGKMQRIRRLMVRQTGAPLVDLSVHEWDKMISRFPANVKLMYHVFGDADEVLATELAGRARHLVNEVLPHLEASFPDVPEEDLWLRIRTEMEVSIRSELEEMRISHPDLRITEGLGTQIIQSLRSTFLEPETLEEMKSAFQEAIKEEREIEKREAEVDAQRELMRQEEAPPQEARVPSHRPREELTSAEVADLLDQLGWLSMEGEAWERLGHSTPPALDMKIHALQDLVDRYNAHRRASHAL